jgi:hypothetical protein
MQSNLLEKKRTKLFQIYKFFIKKTKKIVLYLLHKRGVALLALPCFSVPSTEAPSIVPRHLWTLLLNKMREVGAGK